MSAMKLVWTAHRACRPRTSEGVAVVALGPGDSSQRSRPRRSPLAAALLALLVLCFLFGAAAPAGARAYAVPTRAEYVATTVTAARTVSLAERAEHVAVYWGGNTQARVTLALSLIHISEPTRLGMISYAVFCLKKKKNVKTDYI